MWIHYLTVAWRNLKKHAQHSILNLIGLTLGLTISLAIALFVFDELGYDNYHPEKNRIQRVEVLFESMNNTRLASIAGKMGPALKDAGYVDEYVRIAIRDTSVTIKNTTFSLEKLAFTDSQFTKIFSQSILKGNLNKVLEQPNYIALSESFAIKLFGNTDVIGKSIKLKQDNIVTIGAVIKDLPYNTHFSFNALSSLKTFQNIYGINSINNWFKNDFYTYVLLNRGQTAAQITSEISDLLKAPILQQVPNLKLHFFLQNITDIHLYGHAMGEMKVNGDINQVYLFTSIAFIVLFMAIFNYINFSTALAGKRSKEVGVRQVFGASRSSLMQQFFGESFILVSTAFICALILSIVIMPLLNTIFERQLSLSILLNINNMLSVLALYSITVFSSGFYCAFVLSGLPVLGALKGAGFNGKSGQIFRNIMVFIQLTSAITLMVWGSHIYLQLLHLQNQPLGYNKENRLLLSNISSKNIQQNFSVLKNELEKSEIIYSVSAGEHLPTYTHGNFLNIRNSLKINTAIENIVFTNIYNDFFKSFDIKILAGREFTSKESAKENIMASGSKSSINMPVIINQITAKAMGWHKAEDAIGKFIQLGFDSDYNRRIEGTIVGVVTSYYFTSLHQPQQPIVYVTGFPYQKNSHVVISYTPNQYFQAVNHLRKVWKNISSEPLPRFILLDQKLSDLHSQDRLKGKLVQIFTLLAFIIVVFGLIGLSSYSSQRRLREMAIRQILGANQQKLAWLLGKEFLNNIMLSTIAAFALSFWLTELWLVDFENPISQSWLPYLTSPLIVIIISTIIFTWVLHLLMKVNLVSILKHE